MDDEGGNKVAGSVRGRLQLRFGNHVRRLRNARGFTQEELAERSGLSVDAVRRIERGAFSPSLETLGKLSTGLDISLKTLFHSFERARTDQVSVVCDFLAGRPARDVQLAWRVLQAMFDEP